MYTEYIYIVIPVLAVVIAQSIKFAIETIRLGRIRLTRLLNGSGGMPSTHTAFIVSITSVIGIKEGLNSLFFAFALVITAIVCYDAIGVRWETGRQANTINRLVGKMNIQKGIKAEIEEFKQLKEEVGHKPLEVLGGILVGIIVAILFI